MEKLLTVNQVAQILQVHPGHVRRLVSNKQIKFYKIEYVGVRFDPRDIEKMIQESEVKAIDWDQKGRELVG